MKINKSLLIKGKIQLIFTLEILKREVDHLYSLPIREKIDGLQGEIDKALSNNPTISKIEFGTGIERSEDVKKITYTLEFYDMGDTEKINIFTEIIKNVISDKEVRENLNNDIFIINEIEVVSSTTKKYT